MFIILNITVKMVNEISIILLLNIFSSVWASTVLADVHLLVLTTTGWIHGQEKYTVDLGKPYASFSGIPYAKPPIGDLRFKPPDSPDSWFGIRDATKEGNICIQLLHDGHEDCLYLNVYTPQINKSDLLPVMVYIHGGFFLESNGGYQKQPPDYLVEEDVVVVSFNYRMGIFGFLSTEDEAAYGNWGLKDQIMALHWVQDNIEAFGGNKSNVTLFGHSAGSASVSYLVQTPKTQNLFHRAIIQSGTVLNVWALTREPRKIAFSMGVTLGIVTTNSTVLVEELRKKGAEELNDISLFESLLFEMLVINLKDGLMLSPTIEPDHEGAIVTRSSYESLENGNFNKMPLIIGFVSQEAFFIYSFLDKIRPYLLDYDLFNKHITPVSMNVNKTDIEEVAKKIKEQYFGKLPIVNATVELSQFVTDDQFVRAINEVVRLMSFYTRVHYYRFSYEGEGQVEGGDGKGVPHGGELKYLFAQKTQNLTKSDILTRKRMVRMWTNFAKTSYPTLDSDLNPENISWDPYSESRAYLDIGENITIKTDLDKYRINWWYDMFGKYGIPPYYTY